MARTLTEQEQHTLQRFRDRLLHALSSDEKGYAAGIASALVRFRGTQITEADLERILSKYDAPQESLLGAIKNQLLKPVEGQDGTYTLRTKDAKALPAADKESGEKQTDKGKKSDGKHATGDRKPRRRSRKKATETENETVARTDAADGDESPDSSEKKPVRRRSVKKDGSAKIAAHAGKEKDAAVSSATSPAEEVADDTATETAVVDIAPGRSMRKAAQARNEADEAALSSADRGEDDSDGVAGGDAVAESDAVEANAAIADHAQDDTGGDGELENTKGTKDTAQRSSDAADDAAPEDAIADSDAIMGDAADEDDPTNTETADAAGDDTPATESDANEPTGEPSVADNADGDDRPEEPDAADDKDKHARNHKKKKHERDPRRIPYVRRGDEDDAAIRQKIIGLDQRFWMNGWLLSHPGAYVMFEHELSAMSDALADGDVLSGDITRRQLAYQMGGDEKFFEYGNDGFRLLRAMGLESIIRHRPLPKIDLVYHAPRRRKRMRVLVTENLDPYLDVHDLMYEEGRSLFLGERIHAVVLGGGTPILEHNRLSLLLDTLGADHIDVLYWGDIDRAGLELMCKLKEILGDKYGFEPFTPAYQLMVQKAMERFPEPVDNEITNQDNVEICDIDFLCQGLSSEEAAYARAVIENCCLIPQEILTKRDL